MRQDTDEIDAAHMLSALAISGYALPFPHLPPAASRRRTTESDRSAGLAQLEATAVAVNEALKEQKARFKALYREAKKLDLSADEIEALAAALLTKEQELAARWVPKIRSLEDELEAAKLGGRKSGTDREADRRWCRYAEDMVETAITWLEEYQNVRIRLIKLASDRRSVTHPPSPIFSSAEEFDAHLRGLMDE